MRTRRLVEKHAAPPSLHSFLEEISAVPRRLLKKHLGIQLIEVVDPWIGWVGHRFLLGYGSKYPKNRALGPKTHKLKDFWVPRTQKNELGPYDKEDAVGTCLGFYGRVFVRF